MYRIGVLLVVFAGLGLAQDALAVDVTLTVRFRDEGGTPLAVRAGIFAGTTPIAPVNPEANLYQARGPLSYFYTTGNVNLVVPTGPITIRAGRGFEFAPLDTIVTVNSTRTLTFRLPSVVDMNSLGWYSGDTHVHISHPPNTYTVDAQDLLMISRSEELNFINSMEDESYFTGDIHPVSLSNRIIYFSKEQRNAHFSHLSILGLKEWIFDQGCVEQGIACARTLDELIYSQVHSQPGEVAVIATHPFTTTDPYSVVGWPGVGLWRGMPIDLAHGVVDAIDILNFSNMPPYTVGDPYFMVLSAGFRIPPSAGTDASVGSGSSNPPGACRVFVDPEGAFNQDSWISGLKAGRSFVTNYPLFTSFEIEGARPGDVLATDASTLNGSVTVRSLLPITRVDIYGDTGLLRSLTPPGGSAKFFSSQFTIARAGTTWVAARATGPSSGWHVLSAGGLFAQTAPVYIEPAGGSALRTRTTNSTATRVEAAEYFLERLDETESVFNELGYFPVGREAFDEACATARVYYENLINTPTPVEPPGLPGAWALRNVWPNPFADDVHIDYTTPAQGGDHKVSIYDASGRRVAVLFSGRRDAGSFPLQWDGRDTDGHRVASGVYFVRIEAEGAAKVARKLVLVR